MATKIYDGANRCTVYSYHTVTATTKDFTKDKIYHLFYKTFQVAGIQIPGCVKWEPHLMLIKQRA